MRACKVVGWELPIRALDRGNLVFNPFALNYFSYQLHAPWNGCSMAQVVLRK